MFRYPFINHTAAQRKELLAALGTVVDGAFYHLITDHFSLKYHNHQRTLTLYRKRQANPACLDEQTNDKTCIHFRREPARARASTRPFSKKSPRHPAACTCRRPACRSGPACWRARKLIAPLPSRGRCRSSCLCLFAESWFVDGLGGWGEGG